MSASFKCLECSETADSFEFLLLAHAIKTNVGCASTSSKCTYVLNANSKGPGETAHLCKCAELSELLLLAYAIKANVDCVSTCTEWMWVCKGLLIGLWRDCLFSFGSIFCTGLALAWALRQGAWLLAYAILKTTANAVSLSMQVEKALARLRKCLCSKTQICLLNSSC